MEHRYYRTEQLSVILRSSTPDFTVNEYFLGLVTLVSTTGEKIADSGVGRGGLGGLGPPQSWQPDCLLGAEYTVVLLRNMAN